MSRPSELPGTEQIGAEHIRPHGYSHWTGRPTTPGQHELVLVPQTLGECWQGYCSCGEWRGIVSLWDLDSREARARIRVMHAQHAASTAL